MVGSGTQEETCWLPLSLACFRRISIFSMLRGSEVWVLLSRLRVVTFDLQCTQEWSKTMVIGLLKCHRSACVKGQIIILLQGKQWHTHTQSDYSKLTVSGQTQLQTSGASQTGTQQAAAALMCMSVCVCVCVCVCVRKHNSTNFTGTGMGRWANIRVCVSEFPFSPALIPKYFQIGELAFFEIKSSTSVH